MVNDVSAKKLIEFSSLIDNLLTESLNDGYQKLRDKANGNIIIDNKTQKLLDSISDSVLKQFTYLAFVKDNNLSDDKLLEAGKALMDKSLNTTYESRIADEEERIRQELESCI